VLKVNYSQLQVWCSEN